MANEYEEIDNPTSLPTAASTGYQAQNTNLVSGRVGEDRSDIVGSAGQIAINIAGPTDVNGVLYTNKVAVSLSPSSGVGRYYVRLAGVGNNLTPELVQDPGVFFPGVNGRYDGSFYRVLNWIIDYDGTTCRVERWLTPESDYNILDTLGEPEKVYVTASGTWVAKHSKYYDIFLTAPGDPGGDGQSGGNQGSLGGEAGTSGQVRQWIDAGEEWDILITSLDTVIASDDHSISINSPSSGSVVVGCDQSFPGGSATYGGRGAGANENAEAGQAGGGSFWGSGGSGGVGGYNSVGADGAVGVAYGSGGGAGGGGGSASGGQGGAGATGIIVITG